MPRKYALIIGIENYPAESGQPKVKYALNDCNAMAEYLAGSAGYDVEPPLLDEDASYTGVMSALDRVFYYVEPEDEVALFYAGHGFYAEYGGYLIPYSYRKGDRINESTCISFDTINKRLQAKKPEKFLFLLDTCHSGCAHDQVDLRHGGLDEEQLREVIAVIPNIEKQFESMAATAPDRKTSARVIFTSCSSVEGSISDDRFEHGVFTHFLLQGLSGGCSPGKPDVDIEELIPWTKNRVVDYCKERGRKENIQLQQTPSATTAVNGLFRLPVRKRKISEAAPPPDTAEAMERARRMLADNQFEDARALLKKILEKDPLHWEATRLLQESVETEEAFDAGKLAELRKTFEEWLKRGAGFLNEGKFSEAEGCFSRAEAIFPADERLAGYRERIDAKKNVSGGTLLEQLKTLFPRAEMFREQGKFVQALQLYDHIHSIHPDNARAPEMRKGALTAYLESKLKQFVEERMSAMRSKTKEREEWLRELSALHEEYDSVGMAKEAAEVEQRMASIKKEIAGDKPETWKKLQGMELDALIETGVLKLFKKAHAAKVSDDGYLIEAIRMFGDKRAQQQTPAVKKPKYLLREKPVTTKNSSDFKRSHVENEYIDNGDGTVTDNATGLMWQKGGSEKYLIYKDALEYVKRLNSEPFAGHNDWRLPTVDELASLLEKEKKNDKLYIDPIFDKKQSWCWSCDQRSSGSAWYVSFLNGDVYWLSHDNDLYVRAVRRGQ